MVRSKLVRLGTGRNGVLVVALRGAAYENQRSILLRVGTPNVKGAPVPDTYPTWLSLPGVMGSDLIACFERIWRDKPDAMLDCIQKLWPEIGVMTLQDFAWEFSVKSPNHEGSNTLEAVVVLTPRKL